MKFLVALITAILKFNLTADDFQFVLWGDLLVGHLIFNNLNMFMEY